MQNKEKEIVKHDIVWYNNEIKRQTALLIKEYQRLKAKQTEFMKRAMNNTYMVYESHKEKGLYTVKQARDDYKAVCSLYLDMASAKTNTLLYQEYIKQLKKEREELLNESQHQ